MFLCETTSYRSLIIGLKWTMWRSELKNAMGVNRAAKRPYSVGAIIHIQPRLPWRTAMYDVLLLVLSQSNLIELDEPSNIEHVRETVQCDQKASKTWREKAHWIMHIILLVKIALTECEHTHRKVNLRMMTVHFPLDKIHWREKDNCEGANHCENPSSEEANAEHEKNIVDSEEEHHL